MKTKKMASRRESGGVGDRLLFRLCIEPAVAEDASGASLSCPVRLTLAFFVLICWLFIFFVEVR